MIARILKVAVLIVSTMMLASCAKTEHGVEENKTSAVTQLGDDTVIVPAAEPACMTIEGFETVELTYENGIKSCIYQGEECAFIDPTELLEMCGIEEYEINCDSETLHIYSPNELDIYAVKGDSYICANGRYLYAETEYINSGEKVFLPLEATERMFSGHFSAEQDGAMSINTENMKLINGGEDYYDVSFSVDDIYWMSHIIQAEADAQPLACMIGVGNVVLNRTKSEGFPDTVFEVIFDYQNTAQFTPKQSTALSKQVSEKVLIATYLVLEGYNTVGESLFFQNPVAVETTWIAMTREFAVEIGDMEFYY